MQDHRNEFTANIIVSEGNYYKMKSLQKGVSEAVTLIEA